MVNLNDKASIGALFTFAIAILFFGLLCVFCGPVIDRLIVSGVYDTGMFVSQDRIDTLQYLLLGWKVLPFLFLFGWGIWYIKTQLDKTPGID